MFVGTSHDSPAFAANNIAQGWRGHGSKNYPGAKSLLILADGGGSNGARVRAWKWELQEQGVNPYGLRVRVCHYPTGASKWNPVEHRLFSEITKKWSGRFPIFRCAHSPSHLIPFFPSGITLSPQSKT